METNDQQIGNEASSPTANGKLKEQQYANADKFKARIHLHAAFSTNPYPWPCWVLDQIEPAAQSPQILELGCGNGLLWMVNADRIPAEWHLTLSDFSQGMLDSARHNLQNINKPIQFEVIDAGHIDYPSHSFDIIIANHMLYHLPNRVQALLEIHRILKPGGIFYASTIGLNNMAEMKQLLREFDADSDYERMLGNIESHFSLDNGAAQLQQVFEAVQLRRYNNSLRITDPEAILNYVLSYNGMEADTRVLAPEKTELFKAFIENKISRQGSISITIDSGLFISSSALS